MPRLLYLLALCNLVIGTGAFGLAGVLQAISASLGVGVPVAGQLMTAYAFATALLAPLLLLATGGWSRKSVLQFGLLLFAVGATVCAVSQHFTWMLLGRVMMGAGAVFTPVAASLAVALVPPERRGRALSLTFLGMSMSYVVGLPLTAWLGWRLGWRCPVATVAGLSVLMCGLVTWRVPQHLTAPGASLAGLTSALRLPMVRRTLGLTLCYFSAIFTVFAYIGPVLQSLVPMDSTQLSLTLMAFGVAGMVGTVSGGWATDRYGALPTLRWQLAVLTLTMLLVPLTAGHAAWMAGVFMVWGVAGFGMMTPQQMRLSTASPAQAPMLMSLNASMLYFGTALGAAVGGPASQVVGFQHLAWLGAGFAGLGALTLLRSRP